MRKKTYFFNACFGLLCFAFLFVNFSCSNNQPKAAYIKTAEVFAKFNGKKELEARLDKEERTMKTIVDSLTLDLKFLQKKIEQGDKNSKTIEAFQKKQMLLRQKEREFKDAFQYTSQKYTDEIWKQINQYIVEFGEQNKYDFIYGASGNGNLMYGSDAYNITDQVLEYINRKYEGN